MGYYRAGFRVEGVDHLPQRNYPFRFYQDDALRYLEKEYMRYDVIHASPPCQAHSNLRNITKKDYQDLIRPTRDLLKWTGKPYVIENVENAPLENPVILCGNSFGLKVYRHRKFESNITISAPAHEPHGDRCPGVGRGLSPKGFISITGSGGFGIPEGLDYAKRAMGIDWMTRRELSQAIPPAYTEFIGKQIIERIVTKQYIL